MATDYKEKIRKLLALAESPVEAEAKAALLKARELMAEHKVTVAEIDEVKNQNVKTIRTDITCSKRRDPWIVNLSTVIGNNYCCQAIRTVIKGKQTQQIGFIGLEDDVDVCVEIFKYAVNCVFAEIKRIKKENQNGIQSYVKNICNSYGYGFCAGVQKAFLEQQETNKDEWGLVLVIPKEVKEACQGFADVPFAARAAKEITSDGYSRGYADGKGFDPSKKLKGEAMT